MAVNWFKSLKVPSLDRFWDLQDYYQNNLSQRDILIFPPEHVSVLPNKAHLVKYHSSFISYSLPKKLWAQNIFQVYHLTFTSGNTEKDRESQAAALS